MENSINERIKSILELLYKGNVTAMAKATFIRRTTINSIIGEQQSAPGFEVILKIAEIKSPRINLDWLIRGEGEMTVLSDAGGNVGNKGNNNFGHHINVNDNGVISALSAQLDKKDEQLTEKDNQINQLLKLLASK